jgi:hypothetical protein
LAFKTAVVALLNRELDGDGQVLSSEVSVSAADYPRVEVIMHARNPHQKTAVVHGLQSSNVDDLLLEELQKRSFNGEATADPSSIVVPTAAPSVAPTKATTIATSLETNSEGSAHTGTILGGLVLVVALVLVLVLVLHMKRQNVQKAEPPSEAVFQDKQVNRLTPSIQCTALNLHGRKATDVSRQKRGLTKQNSK